MSLTPFRVVLPPTLGGDATVELDGRDVTKDVTLRSVAVQGSPRDVTTVWLEIAGEGTIEGEGIVHVARAGQEPEVIRAFLDRIDPGELERISLEQFDDPAVATTGQAFLAALKAMVP